MGYEDFTCVCRGLDEGTGLADTPIISVCIPSTQVQDEALRDVWLELNNNPCVPPYTIIPMNCYTGPAALYDFPNVKPKPPIEWWPSEKHGNCFKKGTRISTPDGLIAIEELAENDIVYGFDLASNEKITTRVEALDVHRINQSVVTLVFEKEGFVQRITVTPDHPFLTESGWVEAADISTYCRPIGCDKSYQFVKVEHESMQLDVTYNIQTESGNYLVGENEIVVTGRRDECVHKTLNSIETVSETCLVHMK